MLWIVGLFAFACEWTVYAHMCARREEQAELEYILFTQYDVRMSAWVGGVYYGTVGHRDDMHLKF